MVAGDVARALVLLEKSKKVRVKEDEIQAGTQRDINCGGFQGHFKTVAFVETRWVLDKLRWAHVLGCILKVEPTRFADRLNIIFKKKNKFKDNSRIHGLSLKKRWACYFLRRERLKEEQVQGEKAGVWFFLNI